MAEKEINIYQELKNNGQERVLKYYDALDSLRKEKFTSQLTQYNFTELKKLADTYIVNKPVQTLLENIQSVSVYPQQPTAELKKLYRQAEYRGRTLVQQGKVAAFLVAGGQGTRLGHNGPKGEYSITPVKYKPLFQVFAEQLLAHSKNSLIPIPWYIMTSEANDQETQQFFKDHSYFGYSPDNIFFFKQGMIPAFSMNGELLLAEKDSLALSPDGHGGSLRALEKSGALADMKKRGIKHLSYFQVDNPLVHCIDILFIGLHDLTHSEMSSKVVAKAHSLEKVGNFVRINDKVQVIEYSDMPEHLAQEKNLNGTLKFNAGSIAIHALQIDFIERLTKGDGIQLPWHRAEKKVSYIDDSGNLIKPEKPNAIKLEQFIFDAVPLAKNALVFETHRAEEFSPVKNADGQDSPLSCRRDQIARSAAWLESAGIQMPLNESGDFDSVVEIDPLYAVSAQELREKIKIQGITNLQIKNGSVVYFGCDGIEGIDQPDLKSYSIFGTVKKLLSNSYQKMFLSKQNQPI